LTEKGV
jgi:hypothetical protein